MGVKSRFFLVAGVVFSVYSAYLAATYFYTPLPSYLSEGQKLQAFIFHYKWAMLKGKLAQAMGYGHSVNVTRHLLADIVGDRSAYAELSRDLEVSNLTIAGVKVRMYRPKAARGSLPCLVFLHGGGWVLNSVDVYNAVVANQAKEGQYAVVSVEYRLAPEHPFPAGFEDCRAVTRHLLQHGGSYGLDPKRVAIGGDSAGGNLAAAVAVRLRDDKTQPPLKALVVIYGALTFCNLDLPHATSEQLEPREAGLEQSLYYLRKYHHFTYDQVVQINARNFTQEFATKCQQYANASRLPDNFRSQHAWELNFPACEVTQDVAFVSERLSDPRAAPGLAPNLSGLPPTFVFSAQWDRARDDNAFFARRLEEAGVPVTWLHQPDSFHGVFARFYGPDGFENGRKAQRAVSDFLKKTI